MLLNFHVEENLQVGKQIIDDGLAGDGSKYIQNFRDVAFEPPDRNDFSAMVRHLRRVLCYRALLVKAGLETPSTLSPQMKVGKASLFSQDFLNTMTQSGGKDASAISNYQACATMLGKAQPTWGEIEQACGFLRDYITDNDSAFRQFDQNYIAKQQLRLLGR